MYIYEEAELSVIILKIKMSLKNGVCCCWSSAHLSQVVTHV